VGKIIVVMPAFNAEKTLERTYRDIPNDIVSEIILGDDCSTDSTVEIANGLGIKVLRTKKNSGYGANQKMLYQEALRQNADVIVMVHPDWQYDATKIPQLIGPILKGEKDVMLGSRLAEGRGIFSDMPAYKYIANRFLTFIENKAFGSNLSECHTGFRAYSRKVLETVPFMKNSDDFVFDSEMLADIARFKFRIGEVPVPCRYFKEASSVGFKDGIVYGLKTLGVVIKYMLKRA
jgi:glycosyltransferase involved in cell wall biosynthesis